MIKPKSQTFQPLSPPGIYHHTLYQPSRYTKMINSKGYRAILDVNSKEMVTS